MKIASKSLQVASESCPQLPRQRSSALAVISTRLWKRKNGNFSWENYVKPWDLGYPNIRQTQIWRKNTGIIMVKFWYGTI